MFKELKILKLSLFAIFLIVIIWKVNESHKFSVFFTEQVSYEKGAEITVFQSGNSTSISELFTIKNLKGITVYKEAVDYIDNLPENGAGSKFPKDNMNVISLSDTCLQGVYLMDEKYSLVLKNNENSEITIVFPYVNNMIYQEVEGNTILSNKLANFDLSSPVEIDDFTKGLSRLFDYCQKDYAVNFITDIELEESQLFDSSKLLVLYGITSFYTPLMKKNIVDFVKKGGNILLMSSSLSDNAIWHDNNEISFSKDNSTTEFKISSWLSLEQDIRVDFGLNGNFGGKAKSIIGQSYKIINKDHSLFLGVDGTEVPVEGTYFIGEYCGWNEDSLPYVQLQGFYSNKLLAYNTCVNDELKNNVGGIYLIQPDSTSGKVLSLGSGDWCLEKNQNKKEIFTISKNAIDFLIH